MLRAPQKVVAARTWSAIVAVAVAAVMAAVGAHEVAQALLRALAAVVAVRAERAGGAVRAWSGVVAFTITAVAAVVVAEAAGCRAARRGVQDGQPERRQGEGEALRSARHGMRIEATAFARCDVRVRRALGGNTT